MTSWRMEIRRSALAVAALGVLLCVAYPVSVWVLAQGVFPARANGSLVVRGQTTVGSELIGQRFSSQSYFHPRPSAAGEGYDAFRSGGTNLGPLSKELVESVRRRVEDYRRENGLSADSPVPVDAVTASGSGLDPHISPENARLQAARVARVRGIAEAVVLTLVEVNTEGRTLGFLGDPRVNVLRLNLALDEVSDARR